MPQYQGIWTLAQAAQLQSTQRWATDPLFENTTLLLQADNAANGAQNNTFLDSSSNNFTITRNGNTTQGTFTPFSQSPGWWSNYFDGTGDYLATPANAAFNVGTASFTLEAWVFPTSFASARALFSFADTNVFYFNTSGLPVYGIFGVSDTTIGSTTVSLNAWTHVAFVRSGSTLTCYLNGISAGSISTSSSIGNSTSGNSIGQHRTGNYFLGYISNLRLANGSAIYTSNFIPSAIPITTTSQGASSTDVKLLTCQSNRFIDNSTANSGSGFALTSFADVSVQAFSPFAPQYQYTPSVTGGSGYFDGSGDYLSIASGMNVGTSNFTIEAWVHPIAWTVEWNSIFSTRASSSTAGATDVWVLGVHNTGYPYIYSGAFQIQGLAGQVTLNTWTHLAVSRSGSTMRLFVNGALVQTSTTSQNYTQGAGAVGANRDGSEQWTGYLSNVRLVSGTAVYTSGFTPPTAPLTAIANTSLLCNFTNAGIYDGTMKNNLETVGNAQISTSVVKYGTGSMYFDGSGDNCLLPYNPGLHLSGDFTIECWIYPLATGGMVLNMGGGTGIAWASYELVWDGAFVNFAASSANSGYDIGSETGTTGRIGAPPLNAWSHIAVTRSGNTYRGFVNGVQGYTQTLALTPYNTLTRGLAVGSNYTTTWGTGTPTNVMNGYLDDLRITRGVARYTANFTPPTVALPRQ